MNEIEKIKQLDKIKSMFIDEIKPKLCEFDDNSNVPKHILKQLGKLGLFGLNLPCDLGGLGLSDLEMGEIMEFVASISASIASLITVHTMTTNMIYRWGNQLQRDRYVTLLCKGELFAGFALSELAHGSDIASIKTRALFFENQFVLTGEKAWISGGQFVDILLVFAQSPDGPVAILVLTNSDKLEVLPIRQFSGFHISMMANFKFNNYIITNDAILGRPGFGLSLIANASLDIGRFLIAWISVGIMRACLDITKQNITTREQFGHKLSNFQLVKAKFTKMLTDYHAAKALCCRVSMAREQLSSDHIMLTNMAKYFCSNRAYEVASDCLQLFGASGFSKTNNILQLVADAKVTQIIEGTTEIQEMLIADYYLS